MRSGPSLGAVNAALISIYFVPVWGGDAVRALTSPYHGLEDRLQATSAIYFRWLFDLGPDGLARASHMLAGIKFIVAIAFAAYLIDFARALVVRRQPDRETLDITLLLAGAAIMLWAWPALRVGHAGQIQLYAAQFLMLTGAMIVIMIERQVEENAPNAAQDAIAAREREAARQDGALRRRHALSAPARGA
jgi:hypothetical protein